MCNEGGCGSCVVSVEYQHPVTKKNVIISVNSCLTLLFACHGWSITTVEGIGNKKNGYNKVQTTLAHFNGTQCGYCSPGFVMNMYSLLEQNKNLTMEDIEKDFSGHICRCTGYRPILDAFKSLAADASDVLKAKCADIEDLLQICPESGTQCNGKCKLGGKEKGIYDCVVHDNKNINGNGFFTESSLPHQSLRIESNVYGKGVWYKVMSKKEIFEIFSMIPDNENYMLVAGNSAQGAYRNEKEIHYYIDIKDVPELRDHAVMDDGLHLGANMTLNETISLFKAISSDSPDKFSYLQILASHIELVANVSVRNVGTLAGNLILKKEHKSFPSDIFLILETVGSRLQIENEDGLSNSMPIQGILDEQIHKALISKIIVPALSSDIALKTFKVMIRAQNAPGILNAGFLFHIERNNNYKVVSRPSVVIGGISPDLVHPSDFETSLVGKNIFNDEDFQEALNVLDKELMRYKNPQDESFEYKKRLAEAQFYRFVLSLNPDAVEPKYRSGAYELERGLSSGQQDYSTNKLKWPLNKPMPKVEALSQCSGEAEYVNDIPHYPYELQGALVVTKLSKGRIASIDPSPALKIPGVVNFFSAKDIPGENTFLAREILHPEKEILFCDGSVSYTGQPIGIIVAETRDIALKAAEFVKIDYADIVAPNLHVENVIKASEETFLGLTGLAEHVKDVVKTAKETVAGLAAPLISTLKGTIKCPSQYHFTMEVQSCLCVPKEGELYVYSSSQWITSIQEAISIALNIPATKVNMSTKRLGGAYGSKITRASIVATACAIASYIMQRPVRLVLSIETNMAAIGKRTNSYARYEAGALGNGKIALLNATLYSDKGISFNETSLPIILDAFPNVYDKTTWLLKALDIKTDKACNIWARAPGTIEAILTMETIMEHVASALKKDPFDVRMANISSSNKKVRDLMVKMAESTDFKKRKADINTFNKENRWKKRGISLIPMQFTTISLGPFHCLISVYTQDGSVTVCHGGTEMGQGINTKVSQVVASKLGIELEKISVKSTNSMTSPNNALSGSSTTTENVCKAAIKACDDLLGKLLPIRSKLKKGSSWLDIIKKAYASNVDLMAVGFNTELGGIAFRYKCYGIGITEVELDLLTGKHMILRTDLLEDVGESINPELDIGQAEGAFVMGLGLFTSEELKYDEKTGFLKTNRTWNYHPPGARDIPKDFRVSLLKNVSNPEGVVGSKVIGEPPLLLSTSVVFAIRDAINSGREDSGNAGNWFEFDLPFTPEKIFLDSLTTHKQFKLNS